MVIESASRRVTNQLCAARLNPRGLVAEGRQGVPFSAKPTGGPCQLRWRSLTQEGLKYHATPWATANLNSLVNCRRDKPWTPTSLRWDFHPIRRILRLNRSLTDGAKFRWHFSAVWVGTLCRQIGIFGPLRASMKLLEL